jgi:hypothetical protein
MTNKMIMMTIVTGLLRFTRNDKKIPRNDKYKVDAEINSA